MNKIVTISFILIPIIFLAALYISCGTKFPDPIMQTFIATEIAIYGSLILYFVNKNKGDK